MDCSSILCFQGLNLPKVNGSVVGVQDLQGFKILNPYFNLNMQNSRL